MTLVAGTEISRPTRLRLLRSLDRPHQIERSLQDLWSIEPHMGTPPSRCSRIDSLFVMEYPQVLTVGAVSVEMSRIWRLSNLPLALRGKGSVLSVNVSGTL